MPDSTYQVGHRMQTGADIVQSLYVLVLHDPLPARIRKSTHYIDQSLEENFYRILLFGHHATKLKSTNDTRPYHPYPHGSCQLPIFLKQRRHLHRLRLFRPSDPSVPLRTLAQYLLLHSCNDTKAHPAVHLPRLCGPRHFSDSRQHKIRKWQRRS